MAIKSYVKSLTRYTSGDFGVTGLDNYNGNIYGDKLQVSASAINTYTSAGRGTATAKGINSSYINFSGSEVDISTYARAHIANSFALKNSQLATTGSESKNVNIKALSQYYARYTDPSWGLSNSKLITGSGADFIRVETKTDVYNNSWHTNNRSSLRSWGLQNSSIDSGAGNDTIEITTKATRRSSIQSAYATASENSTIDLGSGNDTLKVQAQGSNSSIAFSQSKALMGEGNDNLEIKGGKFVNAVFSNFI